jgi:hypothetical protein
MPRFHFNINDERDAEGSECATVAEAKCAAIKLAGRTICEDADVFWNRLEWSMTVCDETDLTLFHLEIIGTEAPVIREHISHRPASA